eukprot:TRINITY_DN5079_c0_g1_i2.p1 TRINITY_DN5079_c0_g1~~TRINITY_DN5079_c0_g1_i2.p1  ORF type:complete len:256 (-),score=28.41 TRINITY_DN5079_c0_g1_i2:212-979(-)
MEWGLCEAVGTVQIDSSLSITRTVFACDVFRAIKANYWKCTSQFYIVLQFPASEWRMQHITDRLLTTYAIANQLTSQHPNPVFDVIVVPIAGSELPPPVASAVKFATQADSTGKIDPPSDILRNVTSLAGTLLVSDRNGKRMTPNEIVDNLYPTVAIGGVFDRLHLGHKLLLTITALLTRQRLIVGLMDGIPPTAKHLAAMIQPFQIRRQQILRFLAIIKPTLIVDVRKTSNFFFSKLVLLMCGDRFNRPFDAPM